MTSDLYEQFQKTLYLPLWGRNKFSEIFQDDKLQEIYQREEIVDVVKNFDENLSMESALMWAARAKKFDDLIIKFIKENPKACIVSLGCGLESNFYRIDNGLLTWYDVDLPEVINKKKLLFGEHERVHYISDSIFNLSWLDAIDSEKNILIIAEGVFLFYQKDDVYRFIDNISRRCACSMIFDAYSPIGNKYADRFFKQAGIENVEANLNIDDKYLKDLNAVKKVQKFSFFDSYGTWKQGKESLLQFVLLCTQYEICLCYQLEIDSDEVTNVV